MLDLSVSTPASSKHCYRVYALGIVRLTCDDIPVTLHVPAIKKSGKQGRQSDLGRFLLGVLACYEPGKELNCREVAYTLCPQFTIESSWRKALSDALLALRDCLRESPIDIDPDEVVQRKGNMMWMQPWVKTDVRDFETAQDAETAIKHYAGDLLSEFQFSGKQNNWILSRRAALRKQFEDWNTNTTVKNCHASSAMEPASSSPDFSWAKAHAAFVKERIAERLRVYAPQPQSDSEEVLHRFFDADGPHCFWPQRALRLDADGEPVDDRSATLSDLLDSPHRCLLLVSPGGGGKSSNLNKLFWDADSGKLQHENKNWTPLLFPLQVLSVRNDSFPSFISIEDTLFDQFLPDRPAAWQASSLWQHLSGTPNLLVLLEGLNEVDDAVRDKASQLVNNIEKMVRELETSGTNYRVFITVRQQEEAQPEGLMRLLRSNEWGRRFVSYHLQPLDWKETMDKLQQVLGDDAQRLLDLLGDSAREMLTNPLLLRLMLDDAASTGSNNRRDDVLTVTRSGLYDMAVERLLERDSSEHRLVGVLQNASVARQGLEILAAASLEGGKLGSHQARKPQRSGGGTYLSREAVPRLIARSVREERWGAAGWWSDLESRNGRPLAFAEVADALLRLSLLDTPVDTHVAFLHETFRDYLASGRLCQVGSEIEDDPWRSGSVAFENFQEHKWEGAISFAVERTGSTEPLLCAIECDLLTSETRRRALEVWRLTLAARPKDIERVWGVFTTTGERLLLDAAGYAIQDILLQPDAEEARTDFGTRLKDLIHSKEAAPKIAVAKIVRVLGHVAGPNVFKAMLDALDDPSPGVRVAALLSFINNGIGSPALEAISRLCLHDADTVVRFVATDILLSVFRHKRAPAFRRSVYEVVQDFRDRYSAPADRFTIVRWLGCSPFETWTTQVVWEELTGVEQREDADVQVVRWMAARFLCSRFHRAKLTPTQKEKLRAIANDEGEPLPLRAVLNELDRMCHFFDAGEGIWPPAPPNLTANSIAGLSGFLQGRRETEEPLLWREWQHLQQSLDATYHHFLGSAWQNVRLAYSYFSLAPREQYNLTSHIEEVLKKADRESQASAVRLLCCLGLSDPELLRLRMLCLQHADADVRHHAATTTLNFAEHSALAHQLWQNLHNDLDHTARWDAAGSLTYLVGEPILSTLINRAQNDTSPLARGFLAERLRYFAHHWEAREAVHHFMRDEPNASALARAIRSFELVGTQDGLPYLEPLFSDTRRTRYGQINELARCAYQAIKSDPEPVWTL